MVGDDVTAIRDSLSTGLPPGVTAQVTGPAGIQADLAAVFDGANLRLLLATATVVAVLLIITYRSPVLWLIPLTVVGVADQLAAVLATHALAGLGLAWDGSTTGILSVLVFGAGTDYALLLISRYRDELHRYDDRRAAMAHALPRTAEAVLASAATVVVGLLTLTLSLFPTTRALGVACAIGVVTAAFFVAGRAPGGARRLRPLDLLAARATARADRARRGPQPVAPGRGRRGTPPDRPTSPPRCSSSLIGAGALAADPGRAVAVRPVPPEAGVDRRRRTDRPSPSRPGPPTRPGS